MRNLILLGPPGSGKGTQGTKITARYGIPAISTGDIFRKNISEGTDLGRKAKAYMEAGDLVPDELTVDLVADRLAQSDTKDGYLLDGFPRNLAQAQALSQILTKNGDKIDYVIYINVGKDELIKRITGRRICESCGATYNVNSLPPAKDGICDTCGGSLIQRSDDTEKTANNRIDVYNEQTKPLVDFYKGEGVLTEFDGTAPIETTFERISALLGD